MGYVADLVLKMLVDGIARGAESQAKLGQGNPFDLSGSQTGVVDPTQAMNPGAVKGDVSGLFQGAETAGDPIRAVADTATGGTLGNSGQQLQESSKSSFFKDLWAGAKQGLAGDGEKSSTGESIGGLVAKGLMNGSGTNFAPQAPNMGEGQMAMPLGTTQSMQTDLSYLDPAIARQLMAFFQ